MIWRPRARANLAASLAQYGEASHDPASLLAAAHIINGLNANVGTQKPTTGEGKPQAYDPMTLLKLAKTYATGPNASLAAAIDTRVFVWTADGTKIAEFQTPGPLHVIDLAFHPSGRWLAVADNAGRHPILFVLRREGAEWKVSSMRVLGASTL